MRKNRAYKKLTWKNYMSNPEEELKRCEEERLWYAGETEQTDLEFNLIARGVLNEMS